VLEHEREILRPERGARLLERKPPGERLAGREPCGFLLLGQRLAGEHFAGFVRRGGDRLGDLLARAEAAIDKLSVDEGLPRRGVLVHVLLLATYRRLAVKAEPGEVLVDRRLELRSGPALVDVLEAQQEAARRGARGVERGERG